MSTQTLIKDLKLADAQIVELLANNDQLTLTLKTWDEKKQTLRFNEVVAFEVNGAVGSELSHATDDGFKEYVAESLARIEAESSATRCYALFSSWSEHPLVRIVASGFDVV